MINLSGLPSMENIQKSEDSEHIMNVRSNSIGLMRTPPEISNVKLRSTYRGLEPYDISKADPNVGVFDSAMAGLHANSGYESRNQPGVIMKIAKSVDIKNEQASNNENIDLTRLW